MLSFSSWGARIYCSITTEDFHHTTPIPPNLFFSALLPEPFVKKISDLCMMRAKLCCKSKTLMGHHYCYKSTTSSSHTASIPVAKYPPCDTLQSLCHFRRHEGVASCPKDQFFGHSHFAKCCLIRNEELTSLAEAFYFILHLIKRACPRATWLLDLCHC